LLKRDIGIETGEMFDFKGCECKYKVYPKYQCLSH